MGPPGSQRKSGATAILNLPPLRAGAAGGGWLGGLEGLEHEVEQMVPGVKRQVLCQGTEVFEEGAPGGQAAADGLVALIEAIEHGMGEKRPERQAGEDGGEMLFAVAVVVLEAVALGLERLVVLFSIFQRLRPASTTATMLASLIGCELAQALR